MRTALTAVITLAATAAAAEPPGMAVTRDGAIRDLLTGESTVAFANKVRGRAFIGATSGAESSGGTALAASTLSAGGEFRLESDECAAITIGGAGHLWTDSSQTVESAEQWTRFCLFGGITHWELGYHLDYQVRPKLSAPLRMPRGRNRALTIDFDVDLLDIPITEHSRLGVFSSSTAMTILWGDGSFRPLAVVDFFLTRVKRERQSGDDRVIDVLGIEVRASDQAFVQSIYPVRLAGLHVGPLSLGADVGIGFGGAGDFTTDDSGYSVREIDSGAQLLARASLGFEAAGWQASVEGARLLDATFDGQLLVDYRTTARASTQRGSLGLGVHGFAAISRRIGDMPVTAPTYGAGANGSWQLSRWLRATATLEAARSFYGSDDATGADTQLATQARLGLAAVWGQ